MTKRKLLVVATLLIGSMLLVGCGSSKVTKTNYEKVETGMTLEQVESVLGEGTETTSMGVQIGDTGGSAAIYVWEEGDKKITVTFKDNKVVTKMQTGL